MPSYRDPLYMQKYREAKQEQIAQQRREYYEKHRDELIRQATQRAKNDPFRRQLRARALFANSRYPGTITADDLLAVINRDGRICYWCGAEELDGFDLTIEHLEPINHIDYLTIACRSCNAARKAGIPHPERLPAEERNRRHAEAVRQWRKDNPDRAYALDRLYKDLHRETLNRRASKWKREHREQINEYKRAYRERPGEKDKERERLKAWKAAHPEKAKALRDSYKQRHREELRAKNREYMRLKRAERKLVEALLVAC